MAHGDVTVFGLMVPTCELRDIGMDIPHGQTMVIPAEKAHVSKDLWRAIGQKLIFQLRAGPTTQTWSPPTVPPPPDREVLDRQLRLEDENRQLRESLARQQTDFARSQQEQQTKLDAILGLLQSGALVASASPQGAQSASASASKVSGEAPTFIPSTITPENVQSRIEAKKEESTNTAVANSAGKLRELRKKSGQ